MNMMMSLLKTAVGFEGIRSCLVAPRSVRGSFRRIVPGTLRCVGNPLAFRMLVSLVVSIRGRCSFLKKMRKGEMNGYSAIFFFIHRRYFSLKNS